MQNDDLPLIFGKCNKSMFKICFFHEVSGRGSKPDGIGIESYIASLKFLFVKSCVAHACKQVRLFIGGRLQRLKGKTIDLAEFVYLERIFGHLKAAPIAWTLRICNQAV